jgi:hypothetical protein
MFAAEWGTGQVFLSMLWFFLFFVWLWFLVTIFADIFRSPDLSGGGKALWTIFVLVLPFIGALTYLIARGHKMTEHARDEARMRDEMFRGYVEDVVATTNTTSNNGVSQLETLANLRREGVIDDDEFQRMKAKVVV